MSRAADVGRALDATLAAARQGAGPVEVDGSGPLATELSKRLEVVGPPAGVRPGTVVETTGELGRISRLMQRVDDLGTVVLAGPPVDADDTVDLYADVHVRGLTVIGVVPDPDEGG